MLHKSIIIYKHIEIIYRHIVILGEMFKLSGIESTLSLKELVTNDNLNKNF